MKKETRVYGLELRDKFIWVTFLYMCTTGHLTRMRPSTDS